MKEKLATRVKQLKPSATLAVNAKAKALKAKGIDIINLSAGEPDFDTPEHIKKAAIKAIEEGFTRYTPVAGIPELREAIVNQIAKDYGLTYVPDEVVVTCGAKQALFNLAQALFEPGDEVLILAPYWVSYPPIVELAGATPVIVSSSKENNFEPQTEDIAKAITEKTKGIILNSPSNPTGQIYSRGFLEELAQICQEKGLVIISDDIYDKLRFDGQGPENILTVAPDLREQTVMVNGVSKTYAMTGWRIGWAVGPQDIIKAVSKIQGQSTSNATSVAQKAALEALTGPQDCVSEMCNSFKRRAKLLYDEINKIPGLSLPEPKGTFYAFVDFSNYYGKKAPSGLEIKDSLSICEYLLEEAKVATVPGVAFGDDRFLRISFASADEDIKQGISRIADALGKLA
ncbi:aminotransferase class I and II [Thermodesulfatator indicus DSM 15286]|uniref:Aminotransferase n=1 Tax=Thermodesulfatator indicus (strain DSM 15286 / JCM 11887 / CIR29812) TaxID=667014 RepID=F8A9L7_THEID|nr:pyridoxal phosphate-dependent aminotransferase [Thermodesulfatator indicus]AEH45243.1 aminotransferase class I and II [Thermodesulfatator indicus DSM 15286]